MRQDMTEWLIHFIHRRNPENDPGEFMDAEDGPTHFPFHVDPKINEGFEHFHFRDDDYPIAPDDYAESVLIKILVNGYIQSTWSFRNHRATIYGPRPAVCFTEMPLSSLLSYARSRADENSVVPVGIALRKQEVYKAGGRPVISGLTHDLDHPKEAWPRFLSKDCGLAEHEQYRYVALSLSDSRRIDWTHEREWRWSDSSDQCDCPGLPLWIENLSFRFTQALIIVQDSDTANQVLNKLKELRDAGQNNYGEKYNKMLLEQTCVISLEDLEDLTERPGGLRLEDIPKKMLSRFQRAKPSAEMLAKVRAAIEEAKRAAELAVEEWKRTAPRTTNGDFYGGCGFAWIEVNDSQSELVEALIELDEVEVIGGLGYRLHQMTGTCRNQVIDEKEAAVEAAKKVLEAHFPETTFWLNWRWD